MVPDIHLLVSQLSLSHWIVFIFNRKSSIIIAADESTISWGPSPTCGELVRQDLVFVTEKVVQLKCWLFWIDRPILFCQGYGDNKPKSSTTAQEVKTLDGIYVEKVNPNLNILVSLYAKLQHLVFDAIIKLNGESMVLDLSSRCRLIYTDKSS